MNGMCFSMGLCVGYGVGVEGGGGWGGGLLGIQSADFVFCVA